MTTAALATVSSARRKAGITLAANLLVAIVF